MNEWSVESRVSASRGAGSYVKQSTGYVAFHPAPFPPVDLEMSSALISSLSQADQALARLDGAASVIPDVDLFIKMYIRDVSLAVGVGSSPMGCIERIAVRLWKIDRACCRRSTVTPWHEPRRMTARPRARR